MNVQFRSSQSKKSLLSRTGPESKAVGAGGTNKKIKTAERLNGPFLFLSKFSLGAGTIASGGLGIYDLLRITINE